MLTHLFGRGAGRILPLLFVCSLGGCASRPPSPEPRAGKSLADTLASGVLHRAIAIGPEAGIDLIDVDLARASVKIAVVTDGLRSARGRTFSLAHTPAEWQSKTQALAVVNGGYFGELDTDGRTEIMGLLVQNNTVRHAATVPHAALGIAPDGLPILAWATSRQGKVHATDPFAPEGRRDVRPVLLTALGCGPMLVWNGHSRVTDREERLVSPGARARTFVATDATERHFVMGIASAAEYRDLAAFLVRYFPRYDHTRTGCALCLDGGSSSQLTYKQSDGTLCSPRMTGAAVPDAVVIMPR